jgi:hypothetical protein
MLAGAHCRFPLAELSDEAIAKTAARMSAARARATYSYLRIAFLLLADTHRGLGVMTRIVEGSDLRCG